MTEGYEDRLRKAEWEVRSVGFSEGRAFITEHHYAKGGANTCVFMHGLYRRGSDRIMGVAWWMPCLSVVGKSVNPSEYKRVLALSRLAVHPDVPKNGASFLMARSIRLVEADRRYVSLVTYADQFMEHTGGIYRATGWGYCGVSSVNARWENSEGRQIATRTGNPGRTRTKAEMEALGHRLVGAYGKHKFVKHLHLDGRDLV